MSVNGPLFYLGAAAAVGGAVTVVTVKDLRTAVTAFAGFGLGLGLLLLVIGADLVAGLAVLVCGGVVPAVVLAGMVLTTDPPGPGDDAGAPRRPVLSAVLRRWPLAVAIAAGVAALLIAVAGASRGDWVTGSAYPAELLDHGTVATLGRVLFSDYALPLAVAGVLLLAAAMGATVIARRDRMERDMDRTERERAEREERVRRRREDRIRAREGRRPGSGMAAALPTDEDEG